MSFAKTKKPQSARPQITGSHLSYEFPDGRVLFQGLHFSVGTGTYGIVGPNGVGKSTLLKLLTQELTPTHGTISISGRVEMVPQIIIPKIEETVEDILGVRPVLQALKKVQAGEASPEDLAQIDDRWDLVDRVQTHFSKFGMDHLHLNDSAAQLSGGELVKGTLVKVLLNAPLVVLLDEPTNNLDTDGRRALYEFIANSNDKRCVLVVSHDRELLSRVQNIIEFSNQGLRFYGGNYDFYLEQMEMEKKALEQQISTAKSEVKVQKRDLQTSLERQQRRMHRGRKLAQEGGIPKIMAGALKRKAEVSLARTKAGQQDRLARAEGALKIMKSRVKDRNLIQVDMPETVVPAKKGILEFKEFNFKYEESDQFLFKSPIDFSLIGPRRVLLSGSNGSGKSTLAKLIVQHANADSGRSQTLAGHEVGSLQVKTRRVAYLDQRLEILGDGSETLLTIFSRTTPHLSESERRIRLGRFLFSHEDVSRSTAKLSGGERLRAALACVLFSEDAPELLILDEPTNNLDIDSMERFESALSNYRGAMILITHDRRFAENVGISSALAIEKAGGN